MALDLVKSFGIYNSNYSTELSTHTTETVNENESVRGSDDVTMFRRVTNGKCKCYYNSINVFYKSFSSCMLLFASA